MAIDEVDENMERTGNINNSMLMPDLDSMYRDQSLANIVGNTPKLLPSINHRGSTMDAYDTNQNVIRNYNKSAQKEKVRMIKNYHN